MKYDLIDLGSGNGGAADWAKGAFGLKKIVCIDQESALKEQVLAKGYEFINCSLEDLHKFDSDFESKFCTANHVLEHLSSWELALKVITWGIEHSDGFVSAGPAWDCEMLLRTIGLRFYWGEFADHCLKTTTVELNQLMKRTNCKYRIYISGFIMTTLCNELVPKEAGSGAGPGYENKKKPNLCFSPRIYSSYTILAWRQERPAEFERYVTDPNQKCIYRSEQ